MLGACYLTFVIENNMRTLTAVSPGLAERIQSRTAKIGIVGLGYVGLPLALLFSEQGFAVTAFDVDTHKVNSLSDGDTYIFRIAPSEIQSAQQHGFSATSEYTHVNHMDAVVICVPTPLDEFRQPDLSYIVATAEA